MLLPITLTLLVANKAFSKDAILTFNRSKAIEANSYFSDSLNLIRQEQVKQMEEIQNEEERISKEYEAKSKMGMSEKEEQKIVSEARNVSERRLAMQQQLMVELGSINDQITSSIQEALADVKSPVFEGTTILFGGKDITTEIVKAMSDKSGKASFPSVSGSVKVGYIDMAKFSENSKKVKEYAAHSRKKIEEFNEKREAISSDLEGTEDSDKMEVARAKLETLISELRANEERNQRVITLALRRIASKLASEKGYDIIASSDVVLSGSNDLTDDFIEAYDTGQDKEVKHTSKNVASVIAEDLAAKSSKFKKFSNEIRALESNVNQELMNRLQKIEEMRKNNKSQKEIKEAEEQIMAYREAELRKITLKVEEQRTKIMNEVNMLARSIADKKGFKVVVLDSNEGKNGYLFAGTDITEDLASELDKN